MCNCHDVQRYLSRASMDLQRGGFVVNILAIGDVVGEVGRKAVRQALPKVIRDHQIDFVFANGENASGGLGLAPREAKELLDYGVHVLTGGNHTFRFSEIYNELDTNPRLVRPANYPPGAPGRGVVLFPDEINPEVAVINLIGRTFMEPVDCPFQSADEILSQLDDRIRVILVDVHAEATSEKQALGWYLNGRVTGVIGTHTHVQTADERILDRGTAYITDVGMCGPVDSVLGIEVDVILRRFKTQLPARFAVAKGRAVFSALLIECNDQGRATSVERISVIID
jgi:metallophosphoesterase (TIGR00282 family)